MKKYAPARFWVLLAAGLSVGLLSYLRVFSSQELAVYDLRFRLRGPVAVRGDIVLIEIADDTLKSLGRWPLPRRFHAALVDVLKAAGAQKIIFDLLFSEPGEDDAVFSASIKRAGNVYLPVVLAGRGRGYLTDITPGLKNRAAGEGHINVIIDSDGKIRRAPLFVGRGGEYVPGLGLKVSADILGIKPGNLAPANSFLVNYPGLWTKSFQHLSYVDILKSYFNLSKGLKGPLDLARLKDKICFIGLTATGTSDLHPNPLENSYPMLGLQAAVVNGFLTRAFLTDAGPLVNTILNLLVFCVCALVCLKFLPWRAFLYSLGFSAAYFLTAALLFSARGLWIDLFFPLSIIGLTYAGALWWRFWTEANKRGLIEKELDIARSIQESFLPGEIKEYHGLKIASFLQPAKFVAGDLYDILALDEKTLGVLIGDVSGKGMPAALIMAQAISLFRVFAYQSRNPELVLANLNRELSKTSRGRFVTAQYLLVDLRKKVLTGACAGHPALLFCRRGENQTRESLPASGPPLGLSGDAVYEVWTSEFACGDKLFLYTDGLTEGRDKKGQEFGLARLKDAFLENINAEAQAALENLKRRLFSFQDRAVQHDDMTAVLLEVTEG